MLIIAIVLVGQRWLLLRYGCPTINIVKLCVPVRVDPVFGDGPLTRHGKVYRYLLKQCCGNWTAHSLSL
jgi:hypothetical protein